MGRVAGKVALVTGQIANAILFLASDESSYVNADHLVVDGGSRYPVLLAQK